MSIQLDEHQLKAVKHFEGPALVVAGPGSGKTTVITERILHLIRKHNVDPESILAIAFTNSAADELRNKVNDRLLDNKKPKICTIHVFGKDLITDNPIEAEYKEAPNNVWDANQMGQIIKKEQKLLTQATNSVPVAIYKMEGVRTGQCYIGQTTRPESREQEHRTYSSNRRLREALQLGDEQFRFEVIGPPIMGRDADFEERTEIKNHKMRAAVI